MPGVRSATLASALPLNPSRFAPVQFEGQPPLPLAQRPFAVIQTITPDYFRTMGAQLLHGRTFDEHDDANGRRVVIVNQTLAHRYWPNESAIGKHCSLGNISVEIVGVAGNIRNVALGAPASPEIYVPYPQLPTRSMNLVLRSTGDPQTLVPESRRLVASLDPDLPVTAVQTLDDLFAASRIGARFTMLLLAGFSGIALLLAIVGLYGAISYSVTQRTQELGIRMALGAARRDILALVIGQGLALTAVGIVLGAVVSLWATRLMSSLVFETQVTDVVTLAGSAAAFIAVSAIATYVPARRAARVDPATTLRA
jgi:predicted permease